METTSDAIYKLFDRVVTSLYKGARFLFEVIPMAVGFALAAIREGFTKGEDLFNDTNEWVKK